jgi:hypothetical protein
MRRSHQQGFVPTTFRSIDTTRFLGRRGIISVIDSQGSPPNPPLQLLLIPPLTVSTEANNIDQPIRRNSAGHLLNDVPDRLAKSIQETTCLATNGAWRDQATLASLFNLQEASLVPITMRRCSSTPTKLLSRNRIFSKKTSNNSFQQLAYKESQICFHDIAEGCIFAS